MSSLNQRYPAPTQRNLPINSNLDVMDCCTPSSSPPPSPVASSRPAALVDAYPGCFPHGTRLCMSEDYEIMQKAVEIQELLKRNGASLKEVRELSDRTDESLRQHVEGLDRLEERLASMDRTIDILKRQNEERAALDAQRKAYYESFEAGVSELNEANRNVRASMIKFGRRYINAASLALQKPDITLERRRQLESNIAEMEEAELCVRKLDQAAAERQRRT